MSTVIHALDPLQTQIVTAIYQSAPIPNWESVKMYAKYTPNGEVGGLEFDYCLSDGTTTEESIPDSFFLTQLYGLTKSHWQFSQTLGEPRWYKMIVTVERSGKFSVDFEYEDDYLEGDIMKRG